MASKYAPLASHLANHAGDRIPMRFSEIEAALGFPLPASKVYPAWWSNSPSNNPMTRVWLEAGFETENVDTGAERLVFRRAKSTPSHRPANPGMEEPAARRAAPGPGILDRIRAALGGTVTVMPGVDITAPTGEVWDAER